jgi:outer membrane protein
MNNWVLIFLLFISIGNISSQNFDPLIRLAWENNSMLKVRNFQLESASYALKEAKAMFGPDIKFGTQYTLSEGGRRINFPVGDLLNPVYSTLNQITQSGSFPQISNVNEQFFPNNFYDARFRITQPIFYPDLVINKKLKAEAIQLKGIEIKAFKRQISKDVMISWFQWEAALKAVDIYLSADTLLNEARRSTLSLIKNGVALPSALSRIETQLATIKAQQSEANANVKNAERYLRFTIGIDDNTSLPQIPNRPSLPPTDSFMTGEREEIQQIKQGVKMQNLAIQKEDQFFKPKVGVQLDLGSQDFDFGFEPYALFGLNLEFNIYDNKKHKYRKEAIKADIMGAESQMTYVEDQMELMVNIAKENLGASVDQANTYLDRMNATRKIYAEVLKKYKEGSTGYLELIDAQTQVTQLELQHLIAQNNAWLKWAEFIYASASYPID